MCRSDDWTSAPVSTTLDVGQGLNNAFSTVVSFAPELVLFLVIVFYAIMLFVLSTAFGYSGRIRSAPT